MSEEDILRKKLDRINQNSHYGIMVDTEITKLVRDHMKEREETKMNATSTENFKDIIAIDFELQSFPDPDTQDRFIVSATNRDDIFCFVFEGPNLMDSCRKAGLGIRLEKDQKIFELEEKIMDLREMNDDLEQERDALLEENDKLRYSFDDLSEENKKLRKRIDTLKGRKKSTSKEDSTDNVNHPSHYTGRYECIDVMQDVFGDNATNDFCLCNAFKYIWRARKKNGLEDVKKAIWYLNKYLELTEKEE